VSPNEFLLVFAADLYKDQDKTKQIAGSSDASSGLVIHAQGKFFSGVWDTNVSSFGEYIVAHEFGHLLLNDEDHYDKEWNLMNPGTPMLIYSGLNDDQIKQIDRNVINSNIIKGPNIPNGSPFPKVNRNARVSCEYRSTFGRGKSLKPLYFK
jgi:hypothetical protein